MIYKFPTRKIAKPILERATLEEEAQPDENNIGIIQGQTPDSLQEWWISRALDKLSMTYTYQTQPPPQPFQRPYSPEYCPLLPFDLRMSKERFLVHRGRRYYLLQCHL